MSIDFSNQAVILNLNAQERINKIYELFQKKDNLKLMIEIAELHEFLRYSYNEDPRRIFQDAAESLKTIEAINPTEAANRAFSQFLQYLFLYISQDADNKVRLSIAEKNYNNRLFLRILNQYENYFFYTTPSKDYPVTTWIDPYTGDTACIIACKSGNGEIVNKLFDLLEKQYKPLTADSAKNLEPALRKYLFHENKNHLSAWNIAWLEGKQEIHEIFISFANKHLSDPTALNEFLIQKDVQGDSILTRSVKNRDLTLVNFFLKHINKVYKGRLQAETGYFLNERNNEGFTALNIACKQGALQIVKVLLKASLNTFTTLSDFSLFLTLADNEKISPLIYASKLDNVSIVYALLRFAREEVHDFLGSGAFYTFINHQDKISYSALMWASALNHVKIVKEFVKTCKKGFLLEIDEMYSKVLGFVSAKGFSALRLAAENGHVETVGVLLFGIDMLESWSEEYKKFISNEDSSEHTILDSIVLQENTFLQTLLQEERNVVTFEETKKSAARKLIASLLINYDADPVFARRNAPKDWNFLSDPKLARSSNLLGFFELFCSLLPEREKRHVKSPFCRFNEDDYLPSLPLDKPLQIRKEALFSAYVFIKKEKLYVDSLQQVGFIRNQDSISEREIQELARFEEVVNDYQRKYGDKILNSLKKSTEPNLQQAFEANTDYVLVDSEYDLLILSKDGMFFPLLHPTQSLTLAKPAKQETALLERWLKLYFSYLNKRYTVHPFNTEDIPSLEIKGFFDPIRSDSLFLKLSIEDLSRKSIQALFLLNGKIIQLSDMMEDDFFKNNVDNLSFRAERFHQVFFDLNREEQRAFKKIILKYPMPTHSQYEGLNEAEKFYLQSYGENVMRLIREMGIEGIDAIQLIISSINAHEKVLSRDLDLHAADKSALTNSLGDFKTRLQQSNAHYKVSLQFLVFLFPSVVRSLAEHDPLLLAVPVGVMVSDIGLNQLIIHLANHPHARQLFSGTLNSKLLEIAGKVGQRVPVLGSALAIYGLVQSGKALMNAPHDHPSRPYYTELLLNNLASIGVMGAEFAFGLPFWPVLGVFTALTFHQIELEGFLKERELRLEDDQGHALLRFFRRVELALGIMDEQITTVLEQRELFNANLDYFSKLQSNESFYAIMSVILPEIEKVKEYLSCVGPLVHEPDRVPFFPYVPHSLECQKTTYLMNQKRNYRFELGKTRNSCQKRDSLLLTENYTLLTGTFAEDDLTPWIDCNSGHKKVSYGLANAEGKAAAALVIDDNVLMQDAEQKYGVFLPIDPFQIANYDFIFKGIHGESSQERDAAVDRLLPCDYPLSFCIQKVVVAVTQFYSIRANNSATKTAVFIDNTELLQAPNSIDKEVQYLIRYSDNLHLKASGIAKQGFFFFNESRSFQFAQGKLKTAQGFESDLAKIKELRLEFTKMSSLAGYFEAFTGQSITINRLQGFNETQLAILNVTATSNYAVGMCLNSRLINQALQITVQSNQDNDALILSGYGAAYLNNLYQFALPINQLTIYKSNDALAFSLSHLNLIKSVATIYIRAINSYSAVTINFSGHYFIEGIAYFSRISIGKFANSFQNCRCILEINIRKNLSDQIDITAIKASNFDQLNLVSTEDYKSIITSYIFLQKELFPEVNGNFSRLRFVDQEDGPAIMLTHVDQETQTYLLMEETQTEIVINKITYEIDWFLSSLFAVGASEDSTVIDAHELLAPLKIDAKFDDVFLTRQGKNYLVGNLVILNPFFKLHVQLRDTKVPLVSEVRLNAIKYLESIKAGRENPTSARLTQNKEIIPPVKSWTVFLSGLATTVLTGMGFLFVKRFLSPKPAAIRPDGLALAVIEPLLMNGQPITAAVTNDRVKQGYLPKSCVSEKQDPLSFLQDSGFLRHQASNQTPFPSTTRLGLASAPSSQQKADSQKRLQPTFEQVDGHIMLAYYFGQTIRNFKSKPPESNKKSNAKSKFPRQTY